ncbi:MAG TPA: glycosyltransferase family 39 protein [Bacteroidales bacterium]|nr:glycosyltransferase family 39 protein [Bacteroidales bacterium]
MTEFFRSKYFYFILIIILGSVIFIPFSGVVHLFDWDEIIFAESAREMIVSGDYMTVTINYQPFYEKPPLFMWLQVLSMKVFGVNEFAARFPNAICAIITLLALYLAGTRILDKRFGLLWTLAHGTALLPFFYFQTGIIDPWFNLFIILGVILFVFYLGFENHSKRLYYLILSAFFLGLAVLTKGPVAVLIFTAAFVVHLFLQKGKIKTKGFHIVLFIVVLAVIGGSWFLLLIVTGNYGVIHDFIHYQAGLFSDGFAGHDGFPGFHFVIILLGMFPASVFFFSSITRKREKNRMVSLSRQWMFILLIVVLVLFSIVSTKLVHYSSLAYFPVSFLAALALHHWFERHLEFKRFQRIMILIIPLFIGLTTLLIPYLLTHQQIINPYLESLNDPFVKGVISSEVSWSTIDYLPGMIFIIGAIISVVLVHKRDRASVIIIQIITLLFTYFTVILFVPKVEKMLQGPSIEFFEKHADSEELAISLGFKSFAQYFYGKWQPGMTRGENKSEWIMEHDVTHVIIKSDKLDKTLKRFEDIKITSEKWGYVFGVIESSSADIKE